MIFLPIVERELRVASRKAGTYWGRTAVALAAGVLTLWVLETLSLTVGPSLAGARLFEILSTFGFFACLLPGVFLTADCLSAEKRDGTLGLLFLTDLTSLDVVLGKVAATSLNAVFGLLAILPLLAVPLLLGGVSARGFVAVALVMTNTLFFSLAAGLFVSALSWHQQRAMAGTAALVLVVGAVLPLMGSPWDFVSPQRSLRLIFDISARPRPLASFMHALALTHGCSWALVVLSHWLVLRSWQNPGPASLESENVGRSAQLDHPGLSAEENAELTRLYGGVHRSERPAMLDRNPIEWLASGRQRRLIWASTGVAVLFWLFGNAAVGGQWESSVTGAVGLLGLHGFLKCWVAWEASRRFTEERRLGVLELILVTPLTVSDILSAQWKSLRDQFDGPVLAVACFDVFLITMEMNLGRQRSALWVAVIGLMLVMFLLDIVALAWMGMWMSLKTGKAWPSALRCVARILVLPIAASLGMVVLLRLSGLLNQAPGWIGLLAAWGLAGLSASLWFGVKAWGELRSDFRRLAAGV